MSTTFPASVGTPPWHLTGLEAFRSAFEYASMHMMNKAALPTGDGHPVVIFPGLAADANSTGPLKQFCDELGYTAYDWGRGFNTGPKGDVDEWIDALARHVRELTREHRQTVSLVGWSLGGIYAREVAKKLAARVRQVITIGTPFAGPGDQNHVVGVFRLLNGQQLSLDDPLMARLRTAPAVPTTSIFSRSDGIVPWQSCMQDGDAPHTENIEVDGATAAWAGILTCFPLSPTGCGSRMGIGSATPATS